MNSSSIATETGNRVALVLCWKIWLQELGRDCGAGRRSAATGLYFRFRARAQKTPEIVRLNMAADSLPWPVVCHLQCDKIFALKKIEKKFCRQKSYCCIIIDAQPSFIHISLVTQQNASFRNRVWRATILSNFNSSDCHLPWPGLDNNFIMPNVWRKPKEIF